MAALLRVLEGAHPARIVLVVSNRAEAGGLSIARHHGIPTHLLNDSADPVEWCRVLETARVELVVLAGYLKRVPPEVVATFRGRMINIHPALLPGFGGPGMYGRRVHQAVLASGNSVSGATVHLVSEEYDRGPILGQVTVPVLPGDTPDSLAERVLAVEHRLLPAAVLAAARAGRPVPFTLEETGKESGADRAVPLTPHSSLLNPES